MLVLLRQASELLKYYIEAKIFEEENVIKLENYYTFYLEDSFKKIQRNDNVILICDVISTGFLTAKLQEHLLKIGAELKFIGVFINAIDLNFEAESIDYSAFASKIISLFNYSMKKFRRHEIKFKLLHEGYEIIRIDPFTNTLITQKRNYAHNSLISNKEFVNIVGDDHIKAGYFKFNNLIHPYFFDMDTVLKDIIIGQKLLRKIFDRIEKNTLSNIELLVYPKNSGIKNVDSNFLKDEIFANQKLIIIELERFSTNEGWRFSHPPTFLSKLSTDKKILVIDDGSCSGDSIIQMIDEIALLSVAEIIVISILGRLNDHKSDFFSRIKSINSNDRSIKLSVLFGCYWHIPTYYIEESPILNEKRWLDEASRISNIPYQIKEIVEKIAHELELKNTSNLGSKYLLKKKDDTSIIKDLVLAKEEVGKISSFRFYKEYFTFFDSLVLKYDNTISTPERYKDIELICAVFLHEPELFEKIRNVLPDLTEKIEEFVLSILFGNPSKQNRPRLLISNLFYNWTSKDLFHLFFIVFKEDRLFKILNIDKIFILIRSFCHNATDLSYLLYRFLKFIPINKEEIESKKSGGTIKYLLEAVAESTDLDRRFLSQLKIFGSFISTLPFDELDFNSHLVKIKANYAKLADDTYHNEYIYNDKQILISQLTVLFKKMQEGVDFKNELSAIKSAWHSISIFIEDLLKFSISYPGFFLPLNDKMSDNSSNATYLRTLHAELRDLIYSDKFSDIGRIKELIEYIYDNFIMEESSYPKIFNYISVLDISEDFSLFIGELKSEFPGIKLNLVLPTPTAINFPKIYLIEIIFKELKRNLRYADLEREVDFTWKIRDDHCHLKISNYIAKSNTYKGGGKGMTKLAKVNNYPIKTSYKSTIQKTTFIQQFTFSKL